MLNIKLSKISIITVFGVLLLVQLLLFLFAPFDVTPIESDEDKVAFLLKHGVTDSQPENNDWLDELEENLENTSLDNSKQTADYLDNILFECLTSSYKPVEEHFIENDMRLIKGDSIDIFNTGINFYFQCYESYRQELSNGLKHTKSIGSIISEAKQLVAKAKVQRLKEKDHLFLLAEGYGSWLDKSHSKWLDNNDPLKCYQTSSGRFSCYVRQIQTDPFGRIIRFWETEHNVQQSQVKNIKSFIDKQGVKNVTSEIEYNPLKPSFDISNEDFKVRSFRRFYYDENGNLIKATATNFLQTKEDQDSSRWFQTDNDFFSSNESNHTKLKDYEVSFKSNLRHGLTTIYKESQTEGDYSLVPTFIINAQKIDFTEQDAELFDEIVTKANKVEITFNDGLPNGKVILYYNADLVDSIKTLELNYQSGKIYKY